MDLIQNIKIPEMPIIDVDIAMHHMFSDTQFYIKKKHM